MTVTQADIYRVAKLARLHIEEDAIPSYVTNLDNLLHLVEQMATVNTQGIMPMAHALIDLPEPLRNDHAVVIDTERLQRLQALSSTQESGLYVVPKVIE